jgi:hypothetical protein
MHTWKIWDGRRPRYRFAGRVNVGCSGNGPSSLTGSMDGKNQGLDSTSHSPKSLEPEVTCLILIEHCRLRHFDALSPKLCLGLLLLPVCVIAGHVPSSVYTPLRHFSLQSV